jgi:hypothetical protein
MAITITLLIILSIIFLSFMKTQKSYSQVKQENDAIEKQYRPILVEERKYNSILEVYTKLQSAYKNSLSELKSKESRLSLFNISIGTTDDFAYTKLPNQSDIEKLEMSLESTKLSIKTLIKNKHACICSMDKDFRVNGKKAEATKLINREIKLRIRCLDNEFKAASVLVDWNNINRLIQRAKEAYLEINRTGHRVKTYIQDEYLTLKTREFRLNYEINQLKLDIKEEDREKARIEREAKREETKIIAAADKAEKARKLMEKLVAQELDKLESSSEEQKELFELHKQELEILKEKEKRAISLAQVTRAGYVYVISNELSFGKGVCKIGMTRRADPNDRVKELGDASVPELFNVHAFAFTDDAPQLENFMHKRFSEQRVNLVNKRKEFFHVKVEEVLDELSKYDGEYELSNIEESMI